MIVLSRPLPLVLAQAPARPADDLDGFAADVQRRSGDFPTAPLIVYPELHLCAAPADDPAMDPAQVPDATAQPLDGPRDRMLAQLAGDLGVWLAPGSVYERGADGLIYNTAPVYSPQGRRVASYRKIFPWRPYEPTTPGSRFTVFTMDGIGRVGLSICYDAWFPETTRHLAWMGAELILNLVQTPTCDRDQEVVLNRANAIANQVFVASLNAAAPTALGRSLIVDPEGRIRAETTGAEDTTLTDVIDLDEVTKVRRYGTCGLNRPWSQFGPHDTALELPLYGGRIDPTTWTPAHDATDDLASATPAQKRT